MEKNTPKDGEVHYELLYLIANKYSENELDPIKAKVDKLITDQGGTITLSQDWGKKRLSYAIKGFYHGYYHLFFFNLTPDKTKTVDNTLRLSSEILRHQILKAKLKTEAEIKATEALKAKIAAKQSVLEPTSEVAASETPSAPKNTKTEDASKVELSNLDDKLDELIAADNLL